MFNDGTAKGSIRRMTDFAKNNALPVGFEYFTFNSNVAVGSLPYLGNEYSRSAYADLWSWAQEQPGYVITEAEWQEKYAANNGNVPYYSDGDGSTTFRVPSVKCWVKGGSSSEVGQYKEAGLPNIEGNISQSRVGAFQGATSVSEGALQAVDIKNTGAAYASNNQGFNIHFDASLSNPIYGNADIVQPESIVGIWCVIAFGTITNTGSQDVEQISQGLSNVEDRISAVEDSISDTNNLAIIYPNGGTEEQPAEVSVSSCYIEENPFPGYNVSCIAQISDGTRWASTGFINEGGGIGGGIIANQLLPDDKIYVMTGIVYLSTSKGNTQFSGCPLAKFITADLTAAPCRVLVHKLGKIGE